MSCFSQRWHNAAFASNQIKSIDLLGRLTTGALGCLTLNRDKNINILNKSIDHKYHNLPPQWSLALEDYVFHLLIEADSHWHPPVLGCPLPMQYLKTHHLQIAKHWMSLVHCWVTSWIDKYSILQYSSHICITLSPHTALLYPKCAEMNATKLADVIAGCTIGKSEVDAPVSLNS